MLKIPEVTEMRTRNTFVVDSQRIEIPKWIGNLASFRHWARSDEFPEAGRICYLNDELWVDMSKEQVFSHNQVKSEFSRVLLSLAKTERKGRYFGDGVRFSNERANLSCQPDGTFVSFESLADKRLTLVPGVVEGFVELEGTPDMVLETISASSVGKDTDTLRKLYWKAGVREYWLVDARGDKLSFEILRYSAKGYIATPKSAGLTKSAVFGKSFRLRRTTDEQGNPEFTLETK